MVLLGDPRLIGVCGATFRGTNKKLGSTAFWKGDKPAGKQARQDDRVAGWPLAECSGVRDNQVARSPSDGAIRMVEDPTPQTQSNTDSQIINNKRCTP